MTMLLELLQVLQARCAVSCFQRMTVGFRLQVCLFARDSGDAATAAVHQVSFDLWPRPSADGFLRAATCSDPLPAPISDNPPKGLTSGFSPMNHGKDAAT